MSQDIFVVVENLRGQITDISYVMLAAAKELVRSSDGDVVAVLLGHECEGLANDLAAQRVLYLDHPVLKEFTSDAFQNALSGLIEEKSPRAVLFGGTTMGAGLAGLLSARLELPLVGLCRKLDNAGKFESQIYGGKIMAEGDLPGPTALVTMLPGGYRPEEGQSSEEPEIVRVDVPGLEDSRVKLVNFIEPEGGDADISKEPILIAVGRGVQTEDNIELAQELAELLGAEMCASRPVIDQGWLPISRLVGKSGQMVKPKLYLAMGISGAPEHVEAITDSEMIMAVNTDPGAPIFEVAQYGAVIDMLDLTDALIEKVEEVQDG